MSLGDLLFGGVQGHTGREELLDREIVQVTSNAATLWAWRAEASSRANVAWEASDSARESSEASNSGAPICRRRMSTPEETPRERRGA